MSTYRVQRCRLRYIAIKVLILAEQILCVLRIRLRQFAHDLCQIDERVFVQRGVIAPLWWLLVEPLIEASQATRLGHAIEIVLAKDIAHVADLIEAAEGQCLVLVYGRTNVFAVVRVLYLLQRER